MCQSTNQYLPVVAFLWISALPPCLSLRAGYPRCKRNFVRKKSSRSRMLSWRMLGRWVGRGSPHGETLLALGQSGVSAFPHRVVVMQFFETMARYGDFFKICKECIVPTLEAIVDTR
ncbi:uncharacterized protein F5147DRAFT_727698 [Suillus discolor]|uniref:Exportin-T C-terminal domain-containing protein n=1 Tax=Suillus discolor TaxID=1912936 RepID=A0A9P7ESZ9_9AGAM|nr:uncharacterized protein F5147DRAFT_727698 [Suillus discolor]KAG2087616.1 hypothetical protein F5147DRAFT_727698 [Suillus discolor]